jgi:3-keto-disaccharide hydrolase
MRTIISASIIFILASSACKSSNQTGAGEKGFTEIFDGKTFKGWECDTSFWYIRNGVITGWETPEHQLTQNTFLIYTGAEPSDFELKAEYRISARGNSGIQYRSELVPGLKYALKGYQADIDGANTYTGQNYEERGRGFLAMRGQSVTIPTGGKPNVDRIIANSDSLKKLIKVNDWNQVHLVVKSNHMKHYINGVLMSEVFDNDTENRKASGIIGFQLHVAPEMTIEFRNIFLKQ